MSLWNIIRDFFVEYIFGGYSSSNEFYNNLIGYCDFYENGEYNEGTTLDTATGFLWFDTGNNTALNMTIGDWLSTTATIITLCAICVFLFLFVRWLFRLTAGLFQARG